MDAFSRAVSRNKLLDKYEKKITALEKKVADVSGLLDKMKQFISARGLGEAFTEFVKSLEPKTMKERLVEKQKIIKRTVAATIHAYTGTWSVEKTQYQYRIIIRRRRDRV